jgi:hypothetical protein
MAIDYIYDDSWLNDLKDDVTNLDFSYDPSTAGIFSFNPDNMVFDDIFDTDVPSFSGDYDQYFADSGDWIKGLQENLDDPFDFSYDPFDPTDPNDVWEWNPDSLGDPTDTLKELYPDLYPEEIEFGELEFGEPTLLDTILGFVGGKKGKNKAQGIMSGVGDVVNSPLGQLALLNYLKNQRDQDIKIPIGQEAYGGGQGLGSMPDYRIFNLQPALMPGVGYANAPPPEMKHGGIASLDQGPGDITLARLEPGEFVMTRKATDNIGAKNLYRLMKEAERMG